MIVKMSGWVSPPQPQDYDAIIGNISALNRAVFGQRVIITEYNSLLLPRLSLGSVIQHGGVLYVVQDEEYEISGSASQGANYIRVSTSGDTLAVEWVTSRNGYSWNPVYGYLADGSGRQLLPYKVVRAGDNYEKNHLSELNVAVMGDLEAKKVKAESIDTGDGPVKLNQNLRTTDNPTFATINTGQGAVEAYPMDQGVRKSDSVTFETVGITGSIPVVATISSVRDTTLSPIPVGAIVDVNVTTYIEKPRGITLPSGKLFLIASLRNTTGVSEIYPVFKTMFGGQKLFFPDESFRGTIRIWRIA